MKKFKNIKTGIVEVVTNKELIKQYEKYTDTYVEVKDKKTTKPADKNKDAE